jgi:hypothetical protein
MKVSSLELEGLTWLAGLFRRYGSLAAARDFREKLITKY